MKYKALSIASISAIVIATPIYFALADTRPKPIAIEGELIAHNTKDDKFYRYTGDKEESFKPLDPQPAKTFYDHEAANHNNYVSPDGKWKYMFDEKLHRPTFQGEKDRYVIDHHMILPDVEWSPTNNYQVAYQVVDQWSKWSGRVYLMDLRTGKTQWIGGDGIGNLLWFTDQEFADARQKRGVGKCNHLRHTCSWSEEES